MTDALKAERLQRLLENGVCVVTDRTRSLGRSDEEVAELACAGGAGAVQLREKDLSPCDLLPLAANLSRICRRFGSLLVINSHPDVAVLSGADGVHLPAAGPSLADVRRFAGAEVVVGRSTHSVAEARNAEAEGADYITVGTIFPTDSKPGGEVAGTDLIAAVRRATSLPILAIGGISSRNAVQALEAGADGLAVIGAVVGAPDVRAAAMELRQVVVEYRRRAREE